mmetsp:Transcript_3450/g.5967  ORF Transcript_3450/g.5967 Transcript_3450/m.5967 type:complete len:200 (+) Transcript_3450:1179-1778(+)
MGLLFVLVRPLGHIQLTHGELVSRDVHASRADVCIECTTIGCQLDHVLLAHVLVVEHVVEGSAHVKASGVGNGIRLGEVNEVHVDTCLDQLVVLREGLFVDNVAIAVAKVVDQLHLQPLGPQGQRQMEADLTMPATFVVHHQGGAVVDQSPPVANIGRHCHPGRAGGDRLCQLNICGGWPRSSGDHAGNCCHSHQYGAT